MLSIKKQLLVLALTASVAAPVCAMDQQDSSSLINWKTGAVAATALVIGLGCAARWLTFGTPVKQLDTLEQSTKVAGQADQGQAAQQPLQEDKSQALQQDKTQDAQAQKPVQDVDAQNQQPSATAIKRRPAGQAGRRLPTRKPVKTQDELNLDVEAPVQDEPAVEPNAAQPAAPATQKPLNGKGYGVNLGDLTATKLKKTVKTTATVPAKAAQPKPLPQVPTAKEVVVEQPTADMLEQFAQEIEDFKAISLANQKSELAATVQAYVTQPIQDTQNLLKVYVQIYGERVKSNALAIAMTKLFATKTPAQRSAEFNNIKQILGVR
ncbi:MAG: hypothetical protein AB7F19_06055 [Candidatus Babeliales bacterium]